MGGIGFTMSIFITSLSFPDNESLHNDAVFGTLMSSLLSSIVGSFYFMYLIKQKKREKLKKKMLEEKTKVGEVLNEL